MSETLAVAETVYIGLGSNLEAPARNIHQAVTELQQLPASRYLGDSGLFLSKPMGPQDQPDFINAVARIETRLAPETLLAELQRIEHSMGRVRERHWGPRLIDLDILLFGERIIDTPALQIPQAGISQREFVLYPLARLNPELMIPAHGKLSALLAQCPENGLQFVGDIV